MAYCSQGNHTKFGNRMNYIKEKTEIPPWKQDYLSELW